MRTRPSNVPAALDALGIDYVVRDDEAVALCPNHTDRHPSWSCNLNTGQHNCFSCGFGGSFVRLVMHFRNLKYREAAEWCGGFLRSREEILADQDDRPVRRPLRVYGEADLVFFTPPPRKALRSRSLTAEACQAYGVLWDPEKDGWILPIRDPFTGKLWGWQEKSDRHFRNRPKEIKKSHSLFGYQLLPDQGVAILVESPLDAVRILAAGIPGAIASFGAELSAFQLDLISDRCSRVIVALDDDKAGDKMCAKLKGKAWFFSHMKFFDYADSGAKDPGEMTDEQIRFGVEHAIHSWRVRF